MNIQVILMLSGLGFVSVLLVMLAIWRVPADEAYIRTGLRKMAIFLPNDWLFVLPIASEVHALKLKSLSIVVEACGQHSLLTKDPLRVDIKLGLLCGIKRTPVHIVRLLTILNGRDDLVVSLVRERCQEMMQVVAGQSSLESLLLNPLEFENQVRCLLVVELDNLGLDIFLVSVSAIEQTHQGFYRPQDCLLDGKAISLLASQRLEWEYELHQRMSETALAVRHLEIESAVKVAEWEMKSSIALLEQRRHTLAISTQLQQEMAEIEASQALALDVLHQDLQQVYAQSTALLTTQRKLAAIA